MKSRRQYITLAQAPAFRRLGRLIEILLLAFVLGVPFQVPHGYGQWPEGEILYEEHFDADQVEGWELESGWVVEDFMLKGRGHSWARYAYGLWGDARIAFTLTVSGLTSRQLSRRLPTQRVHVNVRHSNIGRYAIGFRTENNALFLYLFKQLGDVFFNGLAVRQTRYPPNAQLSVEIVTQRGHIRVFVNQALVLDYTDPDPLPPGTLAFETLDEVGTQTLVDNIVVIGPPPPPLVVVPDVNGGNGVSPWRWLLAGAALLSAGVGIGRALTLRTTLKWEHIAQAQWQLEASTELPELKEVCTWACKAKVSRSVLDRWHVTALGLTSLPLQSGPPIPARRLEGKELDPLNEAVRLRYVLEDEAQLRQRLASVVAALLAHLETWQQEQRTPASIKVEARLKRVIKCGFTLYHCQMTPKGPDWVKRTKWSRPLHEPGGQFLGILRGPTAGEPDFMRRARGALETYLLELTKGVRFKL